MPQVPRSGYFRVHALVGADFVLSKNTCDLDPTLDFGGSTLHVVQVGDHFTLVGGRYNLDGTVSNGAFQTVEVIETDDYAEGRVTSRIHIEGSVIYEHIEGRVVFDLTFVTSEIRCEFAYSFAANRISTS